MPTFFLLISLNTFLPDEGSHLVKQKSMNALEENSKEETFPVCQKKKTVKVPHIKTTRYDLLEIFRDENDEIGELCNQPMI